MAKKLDKDVKAMSHTKRGQEIMRLRRLISNAVTKNDNNACWINELQLAAAVGLRPGVVQLDERDFLRNCKHYHQRKAKDGLVQI